MKRKIEEKHILRVVIIIMTIMLIAAFGEVNNKKHEYENSYRKLESENLKLKTTISEMTEEVEDLDNNIYNLFEKKPYKLRIKHDNTMITYEQESFGLFDSYSKTTMTSSLIGE